MCSSIEPVSYSVRTYASNTSHVPYGSGTPQRGNMRVKISVRAEWSPLFTPSTIGELTDRASRCGRNARRPSCTATARSAPRIPTWTWKPNVLFRQTT